MHLRLVSARLITLLRLMRESGGHDYGRSIDLNSLNRQLITMIGRMGGLSSNALVAFTGHEKAQISRAVKALETMGLIERASLRAKLVLRAPGEKIFQTIASISLKRDAALTVGFSLEERNRFSSMTQSLTVRAAQIYAYERQLSAEAAAAGQGPPPPPIPSFGDVQDRAGMSQLIGSQLTALASYLRRSAMLAYQREQGLSNFQWMILSQIGEYEPLPLARLIEIMGRDKSQVGRTVAFFEASGLIERQRVARKRDIMVSTTPQGAEVYKMMCQIAIRRDEALTADFSAKQRAEYVSLLERLEANARAMAAEHGEAVGV
ncbi:MAG: MarR family transcriptional regulator [Sphingobium sp.]|nr:MarR family transcriptional regulator [Sphingobium sp.]